jgi:hypothetical protein
MNSFLPDPETERPVGLLSEQIFFLGDEVKLAMSLLFSTYRPGPAIKNKGFPRLPGWVDGPPAQKYKKFD